jgi:hypothetical protein
MKTKQVITSTNAAIIAGRVFYYLTPPVKQNNAGNKTGKLANREKKKSGR